MLPRFGSLVGRFLPAPEHPNYATRLIKFDNHVGAFVDGPDVVVLVDAYAVGFGPGIQSFPDLAKELAFGTKLQQLRRRRTVGRSIGAVGSRKDEDVPFGIYSYARDLAEIHARRKL